MKITLGGRLSILVAAVCTGWWATLLLAGESLSSRVHEVGGVTLYFLSFPLGWLSGMFSGGHGGSPSQTPFYLLLMIPNSFLLGYSIAGVFYLLRRVCRFSSRKD